MKSWCNLIIGFGCIIIFTACSSIFDDPNQMEDNYMKVIYTENLCCSNLRALFDATLPDSCNLAYDLFYGLNLNEYDFDQNYAFGDTLSISFDFIGDCEAEADISDCFIACDIRHGTPIQITGVE